MDQVTAIAAGILAERAGLEPQAPEPQIAATALLGLWAVQYRALGHFLDEKRTSAQIKEAMTMSYPAGREVPEFLLRISGSPPRSVWSCTSSVRASAMPGSETRLRP